MSDNIESLNASLVDAEEKLNTAIADIEKYTQLKFSIMGKIELLPTPSGNILKALIDSGVTCGVSSRGMGSLEQNGDIMEVQDDFELLCWDFVSTPSNPGSYMHTIKEGKENNINPYAKANTIVTEILCANGNCPIF